MPGLTAESAPHPIVAVVALAAGLGFATLPPRRATARLLIAVVAAGAVSAVAQGSVVGALVTTRRSANSAERTDLRRVTAEQFASAPLVGVGPGRLDLVYVDYLGRLVAAEYTHDEFLHTAAETGVVGAGLAVAAFGSLAAAAYRRGTPKAARSPRRSSPQARRWP